MTKQKVTFGVEVEQRGVKFLGVSLDSKLNWSLHTEEKKLSKVLSCLRRLKTAGIQQTAKVAYFANFHNVMPYGITKDSHYH